MKFKSFALAAVAICMASSAFAIDDITKSAGVVRNVGVNRYATYRATAVSSNLLVVATNVIQTVAGSVRRVVLSPGATTDALFLYNSTTVGGTTNLTNEIFVANRQKAAVFTIGTDVIYDFPEGQDAPTGLAVVLISNGTTTNTATAWISYDSKLTPGR